MADGLPHDLAERDIREYQQFIAAWLIEPDATQVVRRILDHYEPDVEDREAGLAQASLLRDIVGNPWRPARLPRAFKRHGSRLEQQPHPWLTWREGTVVRLAQEIYDGRHFDRLPILADALEEAGCDNAEVLAHCRECRRWRPCAACFQARAMYSEDARRAGIDRAEIKCNAACPGWTPEDAVHVRGCWMLDLLLGKS